MSGFAIWIVVVLTILWCFPKSAGRWFADCKKGYEDRRTALQEREK